MSVSGRVEGAGVNGLDVALEQTLVPVHAAFHEVATARTGRTGEFRFPAAPGLARHALPRGHRDGAGRATSTEVAARVRVRDRPARARTRRRCVRLAGKVNPGVPDGRATLQRRTRSGGWVRIRRKPVATPSSTASTYAFRVRRLRRAAAYRVVVDPRDAGAHLRGTSRAIGVAPRRAR